VWCVRGETNGPAPLPKTGQTTSYETGDDGDLQMGVVWPNPRFTDNADGTITDNLTRLIWLKDANCFGVRNWGNALSDVNGLANGTCGLTDGSTAGDWRLPNVRELLSLIHYGFYSPALPNTTGTGQWTAGDLFTDQISSYYWSSTTNTDSTSGAWGVYFDYGDMDHGQKSGDFYVHAVRGGH